jgi:hypothetical protein
MHSGMCACVSKTSCISTLLNQSISLKSFKNVLQTYETVTISDAALKGKLGGVLPAENVSRILESCCTTCGYVLRLYTHEMRS